MGALLVAALTSLLPLSCATVSSTTVGESQYEVSCTHDNDLCLEEAMRRCPDGFKVLDRDSSRGVMRWRIASNVSRNHLNGYPQGSPYGSPHNSPGSVGSAGSVGRPGGVATPGASPQSNPTTLHTWTPPYRGDFVIECVESTNDDEVADSDDESDPESGEPPQYMPGTYGPARQ
jgi:hypothetical protein